MKLPSPLISWVNPFPRRVINRTIFFCNALESHEWAWCLLSFLYFHWLFPLLARETSPGNHPIYKSTRERVDSKGLCGRWRLHLMGSWRCRKNENVYKMSKNEKCTCKACKTTVFHCQICRFLTFLLSLPSWLLKHHSSSRRDVTKIYRSVGR